MYNTLSFCFNISCITVGSSHFKKIWISNLTLPLVILYTVNQSINRFTPKESYSVINLRPNGAKLICPTNRAGERGCRSRLGWPTMHAVLSLSLYNKCILLQPIIKFILKRFNIMLSYNIG